MKLQEKLIRDRFQSNRPGISEKTKQRKHMEWKVSENGSIVLFPAEIHFDQGTYAKWKKWHSDKDFYKDNGRYLDDHTNTHIVEFELGTKNEGENVLTQQSLMNHATWRRRRKNLTRGPVQSGTSRLEQTFAAFSEHPELLNSPSNQRLFELNLFKQGELFKKIEEQPEFTKELLSFAQNNYEVAKGSKDIPRALFFLQLRENIKGYVELSDIYPGQKRIFLEKFPPGNEYEELLILCSNDQEKRAVYAQWMASQLSQMENGTLKIDGLSKEDKATLLNKILQGYFLYKSLNPGLSESNLELDKAIGQLIIRIKPLMREILNDPVQSSKFVKELCILLKIPEPYEPMNVVFPVINVGAQSIDLEKGLIFSNNKANGLLPNEILEDEQIQRLSKDQKTGKLHLPREAQLSFKTDPTTGKETTVYTFKDRPNIRLIKKQGQDLIIQMKMPTKSGLIAKDAWFELTPFQDPRASQGGLEGELVSEIADLVVDRFVWREIDHPSHLIVRNETNTSNLYEVQLKKEGKEWSLGEVRRVKDNLVLVNPWEIHPQLGSLTAIEDPRYIKAWAKESEIKEFEFPRIKMADGTSLSFHTQKQTLKNGKAITILVSNQYDGFILHKSAPLVGNSLDGEIGPEILPHMFKNFQVLTNPQTGAQKVLIVQQPMKRAGVKTASTEGLSKFTKWSDHTEQDHQSKSFQIQPMLEFDIDPMKASLKSDSKEANLYLAYLFFTNKRYEQALGIFKC